MRAYDFAPLYRSTVGFDRMFSMLDQLDEMEGSVPAYPPYNIERGERLSHLGRSCRL
jgi:molecular chaperone IbpA